MFFRPSKKDVGQIYITEGWGSHGVDTATRETLLALVKMHVALMFCIGLQEIPPVAALSDLASWYLIASAHHIPFIVCIMREATEAADSACVVVCVVVL